MPPPGALSRAVSRLLKTAADELGVSAYAIGRLAGMSQSTVSRSLRGERSMTIDELDRICASLNLSAVKVIDEAHRTR